MKILLSILAACALSLMLMAQTQDTSKASGSQGTQNQQSQASTQTDQNANQTISGKVSNQGKTFTSDKGQSYTVDNPSSLQNYDNQQVAVIVQVDPNTGDLHIIHVQMPQQ